MQRWCKGRDMAKRAQTAKRPKRTKLFNAEKEKTMRYLMAAVAVTMIGTAAAAQECESVIALSKVVTTVVSDKETVDQHAANFCNEYRRSYGQSSSASFGASFKFLAATFGSSSASADDVASKYCSASSSNVQNKDAYRQYIETISPNAYTAYDQCLANLKQDVKFNVNTGSVLPTEFSMSASFVSSVPKPSTKITWSASKDVTCNWDGPNKKVRTIATANSAILECSRPKAGQRSFVTLVRSDASQIPLTLPWQAYDANGNPVDSMAALQSKIKNVEERLSLRIDKLDANEKNRRVIAQVVADKDGTLSSDESKIYAFDDQTAGGVEIKDSQKMDYCTLSTITFNSRTYVGPQAECKLERRQNGSWRIFGGGHLGCGVTCFKSSTE
jgi:hypothetical protein